MKRRTLWIALACLALAALMGSVSAESCAHVSKHKVLVVNYDYPIYEKDASDPERCHRVIYEAWEYWECDQCGEWFSGKPVPEKDVVEEEEHAVAIDDAVKATCTKPGRTEGSHCSKCGMVLKPQEEIPAAGHRYRTVKERTGDAGCETTTTVKSVKKCSVCGDIEKETVYQEGPLGHKPAYISRIEPGASGVGMKQHYRCGRCGAMFEDRNCSRRIEDSSLLLIFHTDASDDAVGMALKLLELVASGERTVQFGEHSVTFDWGTDMGEVVLSSDFISTETDEQKYPGSVAVTIGRGSLPEPCDMHIKLGEPGAEYVVQRVDSSKGGLSPFGTVTADGEGYVELHSDETSVRYIFTPAGDEDALAALEALAKAHGFRDRKLVASAQNDQMMGSMIENTYFDREEMSFGEIDDEGCRVIETITGLKPDLSSMADATARFASADGVLVERYGVDETHKFKIQPSPVLQQTRRYDIDLGNDEVKKLLGDDTIDRICGSSGARLYVYPIDEGSFEALAKAS